MPPRNHHRRAPANRKDFAEALSWLKRHPGDPRLAGCAYDRIMPLLTAIASQPACWMGEDGVSRGFAPNDLGTESGNPRQGGTIRNLGVNVNAALEHACWETKQRQTIRQETAGKDAKIRISLCSSEYQNYPCPKTEVCPTIVVAYPPSTHESTDLTLLGLQSMVDDLGATLHTLVASGPEELRAGLRMLRIRHRHLDPETTAVVLGSVRKDSLKLKAAVAEVLGNRCHIVMTAQRKGDLYLNDERLGDSVAKEILKISELKPASDSRLPVAVVFPAGTDHLVGWQVHGRLQGFAIGLGYPTWEKASQEIHAIPVGSASRNEPSAFGPRALREAIEAHDRDSAEGCRFRDLRAVFTVHGELGQGIVNILNGQESTDKRRPAIFTAEITPTLVRLLREGEEQDSGEKEGFLQAACGVHPYYYGRLLGRLAWHRSARQTDPLEPFLVTRSELRTRGIRSLRDLTDQFPQLRLEERGHHPAVAAFCRWRPIISSPDSQRTSIPHVDRLLRVKGACIGRESDLERLENHWLEGKTTLVMLTGASGIGKSTVVQHFCDHLRQVVGSSLPVLAFTLQRNPQVARSAEEGGPVRIEEFYQEALAAFGERVAPDSDSRQMAELLARHLQQTATLLILDRTEEYLRSDVQEPLDRGLPLLLARLAEENPGLCVMTTCDGPRNLPGMESVLRLPKVEAHELKPLSEDSEAEILTQVFRISGSSAEKKEAVRTLCAGLPANVVLLGSRLRHACEGNVARWREVMDLLPKEPAAWEVWLGESDLGQQALAVMRLLSFFDGPAPLTALQVLWTQSDGVIDLPERVSAAPPWHRVLDKLASLRLITVEKDQDRNPIAAYCHPLYRDHFRSFLSESATRNGYGRLFDYWQNPSGETIREEPEARVSRLYAALGAGCKAGRYEKAFEIYWRDLQEGSRRVATYRLGIKGITAADLQCLQNFFRVRWTEPIKEGLDVKVPVFLLLEAGRQLWHQSRHREAIKAFGEGERRAVKLELWIDAAEFARRIAECLAELGKLVEARSWAERGIDYADRGRRLRTKPLHTLFDEQMNCQVREDDPAIHIVEWVDCRVLYAKILHYLGDPGAEVAFAEAEKKYKKEKKIQYLFEVWGFWYWDFLLDDAAESTLSDTSKRLEWARTFTESTEGRGIHLTKGLYDLTAGRIEMLRGNHKEASLRIVEAMAWLRAADQHPHFLYGIQVQAEAYLQAGDWSRASATLEDLERELQHQPNLELRKIDHDLLQARLHVAQGEADRARPLLDQAKARIAEIGYHRRDPWVDDLQRTLKHNRRPR